MEKPWSHGFVLSAIFMLVLLFHWRASSAAPTSKLVEEVCKEVSEQVHRPGCVEALTSDPRTSSADPKALAKITVEMAISKTTESQNFIKNLASTSPKFKAPLETCVSSYGSALSALKGTLKELLEDDIESASYSIKMPDDEAEVCESALTTNKAPFPEVTTRNNYVKLFSSIGIVVINRL
ncbi:hypothetical protein Tsubulata_008801 [Turnera subulata]|uniref:Pectinesterase inhibitor domain-containing protein n=1 Tax=Turnera subulata TaxID=218843 RepID=A0A9Q0GAS9_9ROSI|nr:hypothetical protein Tsubulata_008801 [Turnera subulata]